MKTGTGKRFAFALHSFFRMRRRLLQFKHFFQNYLL